MAEEGAESIVSICISRGRVSISYAPPRMRVPLADLRWDDTIPLDELMAGTEAERLPGLRIPF